MSEAERRARVVAVARSLVGVPYRPMGRTRAGLDCVGVLVVALKEGLGVEVDPVGYPARPTSSQSFACARLYGLARIPGRADLRPGDVALMRWNEQSSHFGIFTGRTVVLMSQFRGRVVETDAERTLAEHGVAYFRLPGIGEGGSSSSSS